MSTSNLRRSPEAAALEGGGVSLELPGIWLLPPGSGIQFEPSTLESARTHSSRTDDPSASERAWVYPFDDVSIGRRGLIVDLAPSVVLAGASMADCEGRVHVAITGTVARDVVVWPGVPASHSVSRPPAALPLTGTSLAMMRGAIPGDGAGETGTDRDDTVSGEPQLDPRHVSIARVLAFADGADGAAVIPIRSAARALPSGHPAGSREGTRDAKLVLPFLFGFMAAAALVLALILPAL